ncbi:Undecaprenyl-phosphate 4-deoxy-4-formamido-L-arabinose transferase [Methylobacterium crusticola]|uniref:Undecaprenyl-phosphate 4-deoxy-4-formamido-L-arabinose transferase n=1 Tax=Methylobacterium crusticola TaxID=1697972 RepID=A0ABQ4R5V6_9HYPH|nr:glycosyltransferase family 2 protein [Methylobacterium crusticola]GJD52174.1 Undecaprenyl-phosphate 4-deoxy-4-formamido-L-arabinose transferase [Methylobacterium crusticola]
MRPPPQHVSVIMPAFNAAATIERALSSALAQSHSELEVIVVDDGSSDATRDVVRLIAARDSRVRLLEDGGNKGPAAARNAGFSAATGAWLALLDADDAWRAERLERMLAVAGDRADVVFDNLLGFDAHTGGTIGPLFPSLPEVIGVSDMVAMTAPGSCINYGYLKPVFRRALVSEAGLRFDETLRTSEDLLFFLELLIVSGGATATREGYYVYTMQVGSSGRSSPYSHSKPYDVAVAAALARLREAHAARLTPEESASVQHRIDHLRAIAPVSDFHFARRTGDIRKLIDLLARSPAVRRELARGVARRMRGRAASPARTTPDA